MSYKELAEKLKSLLEKADGPLQQAENDSTLVMTQEMDDDGNAHIVADFVGYAGASAQRAADNATLYVELVNNIDTIISALEKLEYLCNTDGYHNGTPRIIDLCYTAFVIAKQKNNEDGGSTDWFNDTHPIIVNHIESIFKNL